GLEMDVVYGQTGNCGAGENKAGAACVGEKKGSSSGSSLNTDISGIVEFKWLYTEFDLTGKDSLLPFIPVNTRARAGLQPFATLGTYRATYTAGDFPGISAVTEWAPNLKTSLAYVMIDEELGTFTRAGSGGAAAGVFPTRGDDFAIIFSPEFTPFKGLDIKPLYSYFFAQGITSGSSRRSATNITTPSAFQAGFAGNIAGAPAYQQRNNTAGGAGAADADGDPPQPGSP